MHNNCILYTASTQRNFQRNARYFYIVHCIDRAVQLAERELVRKSATDATVEA